MFENKKRDITIIISIFLAIGLVGFSAPFVVKKLTNIQKQWSQRTAPSTLSPEEKSRVIKENEQILERIKKNDKNGEPNFSSAYAKLASNEELLGQLWRAEEYYGKALKEDRSNRTAHENFASLLAKLGRNTEAAAQYRAAIESEPATPGTYSTFARFADYWLKDRDMARGIYIEGLMRTSNNAVLMKDFALFLEQTGDKYQAYLYWVQILKKEPSNKEALSHIQTLKPQVQDALGAPVKKR